MTDDEFVRFHAETAAPLHAYVSRVGGSESLADDLVQSAYMRFLRARRRPTDPRARRVYLFRIARNLLRDEFTKRVRERAVFDADGRSEGVDARRNEAAGLELDGESRIEVRRAFGALSERDRELLWLVHVLGLTHREIAEVADVAEASVRVLVHRARRRFAEALTCHGIGPEDLP